jgi:TonB family protein
MKSAVLLIVFLLVGTSQSGAQTATRQVYKPGQGVVSPQLVYEVKPVYTGEALQNGIQGSAQFECVINEDGTVGDVRVLKSLDPDLDAEAVKALKRWRFKPGSKDGVDVAVAVEVEVSFTLGSQGPRLGSSEVLLPGQEGVTLPKVVSEVKASYTSEAITARIEGTVMIQAVVLANGRVGDARVTRALDSGLDAEALKALRQWRFEPGKKDGTPVPTQLSVEMTFTLK